MRVIPVVFAADSDKKSLIFSFKSTFSLKYLHRALIGKAG
jgi:hypothetical protein